MSAARRIATIPIIGTALALIAFGVVRGAMSSGPARGVRMRVALEPPVAGAAREAAIRAIPDRFDRQTPLRIASLSDGLVVEVGTSELTAERIAALVALVERPAHAAPEPAGSAAGASPGRAGGAADAAPAPAGSAADAARVPAGSSTAALPEQAGSAAAAIPAMRVVHHETFTRATGFVPRAWPFLAAGGVLLVVAAFVWRRRS